MPPMGRAVVKLPRNQPAEDRGVDRGDTVTSTEYLATSMDHSGSEWLALLTIVVLVAVIFIARYMWLVQIATSRLLKTPPPGVAKPPKRAQSANVLVGADNRISTSKTIAFAWTLVVAFMVITVGYVATGEKLPGQFLTNTLGSADKLYLVLLGGPYAAAVLAKVAVANQTNSGTLQKTVGTPSPLDIVANDSGATDLYDTQYTFFNLIVIIIVLALFLPSPAAGLPAIPDFLAMLTGGAALTYTLNKAAGGNPAVLKDVIPASARVGSVVSIYGQNLAMPADDTAAVLADTVVTVGGQTADVTEAKADRVTFTVPPYPGGSWPAKAQDIELKTNGNDIERLAAALTIAGASPEIIVIEPSVISVAATPSIAVRGRWFRSADPTVADPNDCPSVELVVSGKALPCQVANAADPGRDTKLIVTLPNGLAGALGGAAVSHATITVTRTDNASTSTVVTVTP
jgi:hypothetical protein